MKRFFTLTPEVLFTFPAKWKGQYLIFLVCILVFSFAILKPWQNGLDAPEPMGKFLNGNFPALTPGGSGWDVENAFPNLTFVDPVDMEEIPGHNKFVIASKIGELWVIDKNSSASTKQKILDISNNTKAVADGGLLGILLHPQFTQVNSPNAGYIYVFYKYTPDKNLNTQSAYMRLSRFTMDLNTYVINPSSEMILFQQYDRHEFHNGGSMFFGPEGFMYICVGQEGAPEYSETSTQRFDLGLFSGIMRIDVDMDPSRSHPIRRHPVDVATLPAGWPASMSQNYYIPNDNPWQDPSGQSLEEFYALGIRSPHRMSYDPVTGWIWLGDVGTARREEVNIIKESDNCQWPILEGDRPGVLPDMPPSGIGNDTPPYLSLTRDIATCVIGGFVYRGQKWKDQLEGIYLFGDHVSRNIMAIDYDPTGSNTHDYFHDLNDIEILTTVPAEGVGNKSGIAHFDTDAEGEIYVLKLFGTNQDGGKIYKLKQATFNPEPPALLSQTGFFSDLSTLTPAAGVIPYSVNSPLWSDGAAKNRWVAIPNDGSYNTAEEQVQFTQSGDWVFPSGTVLAKHFELPIDETDLSKTVRLETRFSIKKDDGLMYFVTYRWNEAGTDAYLIDDAESRQISVKNADGHTEIQRWDYPSRFQCLSCHNPNAGDGLGLSTHQLNGDLFYPSTGRTDNQLRTWNALGIFNPSFTEAELGTFPKAYAIDDPSASLDLRIRSYLDANCAHCHQPDGGVYALFDVRFETPLAETGMIYGPTLGSYSFAPSFVVVPQDPEHSMLWIRDNSVDDDKMPPLGKLIVDDKYMPVLTEWINSLDHTQFDPCANLPETYLSDMVWLSVEGRIKRDVGHNGNTMTIEGVTYDKGLGVHSPSVVEFALDGLYSEFLTDIGLDDDCSGGQVIYRVFVDNVKVYESDKVFQADPAISLAIDVTGASRLRLEVDEVGNTYCDHSNWANARLKPLCDYQPSLPIAQPGNDKTFIDLDQNGSEDIQLDGSLSSDPNGTLVNYVWTLGSTTLLQGVTGTVNLPIGTHTIDLAVTDNDGNTTTETQVITVLSQLNQHPVANAGPDFGTADNGNDGIETVNLDASASTDPDGTITKYEWIYQGSVFAQTQTASLNLAIGTHTVLLAVSDDQGAQNVDELTITVGGNLLPTADAGLAQQVTDTDGDGLVLVNLDASASNDPDGSIIEYNWSKDGIPIANTAQTTYRLEGYGVHIFTVQVIDNRGGVASSTVQVEVLRPSSQVIALEAECASVGSLWTVNNDANAAGGKYVVFTGNDSPNKRSASQGPSETGADHLIRFDFHVASAGNYHVYARAKTPTGNDDSFWIRINGGPWRLWFEGFYLVTDFDWVNLKAVGQSNPVSLNEGNNTVEFTYRENGAQLDKLILRNDGQNPQGIGEAPLLDCNNNQSPIANAGPDIQTNASNGTASITLDASASSDADGSIVSYTWSQNGQTIAQLPQVDLDLAPGVYNYLLTVIDNQGASSQDPIQVVVTGNENIAPVANAGPNQTIEDTDADGTVSVNLDGSASSDADGSIQQYEWLQDGNVIANTAQATISLSAYQTHILWLKVTDNAGDVDSSQVAITVVKPSTQVISLEAECANLGAAWTVQNSIDASEGQYVVYEGNDSPNKVSASQQPSDVGAGSVVSFTFNVANTDNYNVFVRTSTPSVNDDSFWIRVNGGPWHLWFQGFYPPQEAYRWVSLQAVGLTNPLNLSEGSNTIEFTYRENGARLDKIIVRNDGQSPTGMGETAWNVCNFGGGLSLTNQTPNAPITSNTQTSEYVSLYPVPFSNALTINFKDTKTQSYTLYIRDQQGKLMYEGKVEDDQSQLLIGNNWPAGMYTLQVIRGNQVEVFNVLKR